MKRDHQRVVQGSRREKTNPKERTYRGNSIPESLKNLKISRNDNVFVCYNPQMKKLEGSHANWDYMHRMDNISNRIVSTGRKFQWNGLGPEEKAFLLDEIMEDLVEHKILGNLTLTWKKNEEVMDWKLTLGAGSCKKRIGRKFLDAVSAQLSKQKKQEQKEKCEDKCENRTFTDREIGEFIQKQLGEVKDVPWIGACGIVNSPGSQDVNYHTRQADLESGAKSLV